MINIRTDTIGNLCKHSVNILTECLWAAVRRFRTSLPPEIIPGEWVSEDSKFTNTLLYERTGQPCGVTARVDNPGTNIVDILSMELETPDGTVHVWRPSPIDEFMVNQAAQDDDLQDGCGQMPMPETHEDIEATIDEFIDELFGDSFQHLVLHSRPIVRTVGTARSLKFNLITILEDSIMEAMEKRGKDSLPFVCRLEAWELRVVTDAPDDEDYIVPGKRIVFLKDGDNTQMEFMDAPVDVMFAACLNALDEQDQD